MAAERANTQDNGFLPNYLKLPQKDSTTIRFFERRGYYTVHGEDATFVANEHFKTESVIKTWTYESQSLATVNLSKQNFESCIKELLFVCQYRVEVYRNAVMMNLPHRNVQLWRLECKASPGNLVQLEDVLFGKGDAVVESKGIIAIKVRQENKNQVIGIAFGDALLRQFQVAEFSDSSSFTDLEAVIVQLSPKECLLFPGIDAPLAEDIKNIVKRNNVLFTECKAGDFTASDINQDLNRLLRSDNTKLSSSVLPETELKISMQCVAAIIKYFELLSDEDNFGQYTLETFNSKQYMRICASSVKNLGILPIGTEEHKNQTLLGVLNYCKSPQGQRLLYQWIKQPLMDKMMIEHRLDVVEIFVNNIELRQYMATVFLNKMPDLHMMAKKFQKLKGNLKDVHKVYMLANRLPRLHQELSSITGPLAHSVSAYCIDTHDRIEEFRPYIEMVELIVDLEAVKQGDYLVKASCDSKLEEVKGLMTEVLALMNQELQKVADDLGLEASKTVKMENSKQHGYTFRVTRKDEKALRGKKHYKTIDTKQNGVRFFSPRMREHNEKYESLRSSYERQQKKVVEQLMGVAASYCLPMRLLGETVAQLDVFVSLASAAVNAPKPYIRPKLYNKGEKGILLKQARHPCVEVQPKVDFIANDAEMIDQTFHIVTGPNMGGKSTYIRSIALNVLMAQIGSFVPCDYAEISLSDSILSRIGAGDKPTKGISTFLAEMLEVKNILNIATSDTLIIMDELGRGTSTYDGFGLAWAISAHIAHELKSYCLFTTHFHELSALSEEIKSVKNSHVTAVTHENEITYLYKVKPGVCDQSFGIHVAEMADFPKTAIEYASEKLKDLEKFEMSYSLKNSDGSVPAKKMKFSEKNVDELEKFLRRAVEIGKSGGSAAEVCETVKELKMDIEM